MSSELARSDGGEPSGTPETPNEKSSRPWRHIKSAAPAVETRPAVGEGLIDLVQAMKHVAYLSEEIGQRFTGSKGEVRAADYVSRQLAETGRPVELQFFDLPDGGKSRNVSIFIPGESRDEFVIGAHIDTSANSPGANDNASGAAILLELARVFSERGSPADLRLIFFGGEELIKSGQNHHHFGSRHFLHAITDEEVGSITGMISIDMAGFGETMRIHSTGAQPTVVRDGLRSAGKTLGLDVEVLMGSAASDHESFEAAGVPASWIGYHPDPENHTSRDTILRINAANLDRVASVVYEYVARNG